MAKLPRKKITMKKYYITILIISLVAIAGYLLYKFCHFIWWGPFIAGGAIMLLILCTIGKAQFIKAGNRVQKIINDQSEI